MYLFTFNTRDDGWGLYELPPQFLEKERLYLIFHCIVIALQILGLFIWQLATNNFTVTPRIRAVYLDREPYDLNPQATSTLIYDAEEDLRGKKGDDVYARVNTWLPDEIEKSATKPKVTPLCFFLWVGKTPKVDTSSCSTIVRMPQFIFKITVDYVDAQKRRCLPPEDEPLPCVKFASAPPRPKKHGDSLHSNRQDLGTQVKASDLL